MKTKEQKAHWLKEAKAHRKADRFIQGAWIKEMGEDGIYRGCEFGCLMQTKDEPLQKASEAMDLPLWMIHVAEKIFEGLPAKEAVEFPVQFIAAIKVGKDHKQSYKDFFYRFLMDGKYGQTTFTKKGNEQYNAIKQCADLFKMDVITRSAARSARSAAWSADSAAWSVDSAAESARSAARSAAESAAWSAAWSAESAESAADSAAWSAESATRSIESAARSARSGHYEFLRDILLKSVK